MGKRASNSQGVLVDGMVGLFVGIAITTVFALIASRAAHAITDPWSDPNVYASSIPGGAAAWSCDKGCESWVDEKGQYTAPDPQTCADLGAAYDNTQATGGGALASPTPMASMTADQADTFIACKMANTQVVSYCQAYKLNKKAEDSQVILLPLDVAAAAICWAACSGQVLPGAGQALVTACEIAGAAAGTMQFIELARLNTLFGEVTNGRTLEMIASGLGVASAAGGAAFQVGGVAAKYKAGSQERAFAKASGERADVNEKLADVATDPDVADQAADEAAAGRSDQEFGNELAKDAGEGKDAQANDNARKMACVTAATFTALSAVRGISWGIIASNKGKACKDAENLMNGGAGTAYDPSTSAGLVAGGASTWQATGSGSAGGGTGGTTTTTDTATDTTSTTVTTDACTSGLTSCDSSGQASAAIDGQLLSRSGLDKAVAQYMAGKDLSGVVATARRQGTGAAIAGLAQRLGADAGAASQLAAVARTVEDNREKFLQAFGANGISGSVYASSAGGNGRLIGGQSGIGGFFGAAPAGVNTAFNNALAQFGIARGIASNAGEADIWHTGTDLNIFQIVSNRIGSVTPRLHK